MAVWLLVTPEENAYHELCAWTLSRGQDIVPLIGARTPERLSEALGALTVTLGESDLAAIDRAASPVGGDREH